MNHVTLAITEKINQKSKKWFEICIFLSVLECSTSDIQLTAIGNLSGRKRADRVGETIDYEFEKKGSPAHKASPAPRKARLVWKRVSAEV